MGRLKSDSPTATPVTLERAARLSRLLQLIARTPRPRVALLGKLRLDVRGFYRDLKTLRDRGIEVTVAGDSYRLADDLDAARAKLPCPDPLLNVAELRVLSKGSSEAHRKLRKLLDALGGSGGTNGKH